MYKLKAELSILNSIHAPHVNINLCGLLCYLIGLLRADSADLHLPAWPRFQVHIPIQLYRALEDVVWDHAYIPIYVRMHACMYTINIHRLCMSGIPQWYYYMPEAPNLQVSELAEAKFWIARLGFGISCSVGAAESQSCNASACAQFDSVADFVSPQCRRISLGHP